MCSHSLMEWLYSEPFAVYTFCAFARADRAPFFGIGSIHFL